jgi:hypothetical protein
MPKRAKHYGLALVGVGIAVGVIAPAVIAQGTDTDDFIQPGSTVVQISQKPVTLTKFSVIMAGVTVITDCGYGQPGSTSGKTPAHGLVMVVAPMSFPRCTTNLGGSAHVTTTGVWHVTFVDAPNDEAEEAPPSGCSFPPCIIPPPPPPPDKLAITVPIKGMTETLTAAPGCTVSFAQTAPGHAVGVYDDVNTLTLSGGTVPFATSSGCPGGMATGTGHFIQGTYLLTPGVHDGVPGTT